jgi:hypothetical protein
MFKGLNWVGVIVSLVFGQVLGYVWWNQLFKASLGGLMDKSGNMPMIMGEGIVLAAVMLIGIAWVIKSMGEEGYVRGALTGLGLWLFFPACGYMLDYVYMAGKNSQLLLANLGYTLVFFMVSGALIGGLKLGKPAAAAA